MSEIINGGFLTGEIVSPLYKSHIKSARELLNGYSDDMVSMGCDDIFRCVTDWFDGSDYQKYKGLADVDPRAFYTVPSIPGKVRSCADIVMQLIVGVEYAPLCKLARKKSLLIMMSQLLLYYSVAGRINEVDSATIWLSFLIDKKDQLPINFSVDEQIKLMEKKSKYDVRLLCLVKFLSGMEQKSNDKGLYFDAQSICYTRVDMRQLLNDSFPSVFQSISQATFNDFWKKQKLCKLKDGRR